MDMTRTVILQLKRQKLANIFLQEYNYVYGDDEK